MKTLRNLLLVLTSLIATVAFALTPAERILLFGKINPVWTANFLTTPFTWSWSGSAWVSSPAGLTYAGQSQKYQFDSTGTLTTGPNNVKTYSNTFTDASWTKGSTAISNANAVADPFGGTQASTITATGAYGYLQGLHSSTTGYNAISSIWVRLRSGNGSINLYKTNGSGAVNKTATSSWQQIYVSGGTGNPYTYLKMEIPNNGDVLDIYQGAISIVTYETAPRSQDQFITQGTAFYGPRQDYTYTGSAWVPAGMLVEQASSGNLVPYSNPTTSAHYNSVNTTIDASPTVTGPDGTTSITKYAFDSSNSAHSVYNTATTSGSVTFSVVLAAGTNRYISVAVGNGTGEGSLYFYATVDTGVTPFVVTQTRASGSGVSVGTPVVQTLANSTYRVSVPGVLSATSTTHYLFIIASNTATPSALSPSFVANSNTYSGFWQLEPGTFPLSILPNPTATSPGPSRAADVVSLNGVPLAATKSANGSFIAQTQLRTNDTSTYQAVLSANDGVNFPVPAYWYSTPKHANAYNGSNFLSTANNLDMTLAQRIATAWSASGRSLVASNGSVVSDAYTAFGGYSFNAAYLGGNNSGTTNIINGWLQSVSFYNQRLPDPTLKAKSVVGAPY